MVVTFNKEKKKGKLFQMKTLKIFQVVVWKNGNVVPGSQIGLQQNLKTCASKNITKKVKRQLTECKKYLQFMYLISVPYLDCLENLQLSN